MIRNINVLSNMEQIIQNSLLYSKTEKSLSRAKRNLTLKKQNPLWKFADSDCELSYRFEKIISPISHFGIAFDCSSFFFLSILIGGVIVATKINQLEVANQLNCAIDKFKVVTMPVATTTVPFFLLDGIQKKQREKLNQEKLQIEILETRKKAEQVLPFLQELKHENFNSQNYFIESFLNHVNLSHNSVRYNLNLLYLLSNIAKDNSEKNLQELAKYLAYSKTLKEEDIPSDEFLESDSVKQFVKSYLS